MLYIQILKIFESCHTGELSVAGCPHSSNNLVLYMFKLGSRIMNSLLEGIGLELPVPG